MTGPGHAHIAVIDPATRVAELEAFNHLAQVSPLPLTYHLPALFGTGSLEDEETDSLSGIVIFGSGVSVHDRNAWQGELEQWLRPLLEKRVPTLGLCYGHQMLAYMAGASVGPVHPDRRKLKGIREMQVKNTPAWDEGKGPVIVSHNETVTSVPEGWEVVASSPQISIEGLAHQSLPVWSFQSHPEATRAFLEHQSIPIEEAGDVFAFGHGLVAGFLNYAASIAKGAKFKKN